MSTDLFRKTLALSLLLASAGAAAAQDDMPLSVLSAADERLLHRSERKKAGARPAFRKRD